MTRPVKRGAVHIPKSALGQQLAEAAAIKRAMTDLLRQLEESATGQAVARPGTWRLNPTAWLDRFKLPKR